MSSERAAFAATRVRSMFSSTLAAMPTDGVAVFWFYTMHSPEPRFSRELRELAYRKEFRRWGRTDDGVGRLDEHYRCGMIWFATPLASGPGGAQQVRMMVAGKGRRHRKGRVPATMEGRLPAQLSRHAQTCVKDYFVEDLIVFMDSDDQSLGGANDGCVIGVLEYSLPEQSGPGPVQQLIRKALLGPYTAWTGDGEERKRWIRGGLALSTDWFIKV